jgi:hypothetical protein
MRIKAVDLVDVLVYLIVLGTFSRLFPKIISESFLTTLVTAILLVLEVVVRMKKRIVGRIKAAETPRVKAV